MKQNSNEGQVNAVGVKNSGGAWNVGGTVNARGAKESKWPKICYGCGKDISREIRAAEHVIRPAGSLGK